MKTLAVTTDPDTGITDLDGTVTEGIEALRQRVVQRLAFRRGTWALNPTAGTDRIVGHSITARLAAQRLTAAIRDEGQGEITDIRDVTFRLDAETRRLHYSAVAVTIYGDLPISTVA